MPEQKNYYAIIPANVRYDPDLKDKAKLLYGEITALCNEKGYCWATNDYFASLYGVSKTTISLLIKNLIESGYINSQIIYKEGTKEILNRYLSIVNDPIKENLNTPIKEKLKDNNTSFNNKNNNTYNNRFKKPTIEEVQQYCNERNNNINAEQFIDYYDANGWKVGKNPMKDWKAAIRTWERRNDNKPTRKEIVPDWINKKQPTRGVPSWVGKEIKEEYLSDEQVEIMEKLMRGEEITEEERKIFNDETKHVKSDKASLEERKNALIERLKQ